MGITNYNKELNATQISCNDTFGVRLALTAEPDITANPVDIVLICHALKISTQKNKNGWVYFKPSVYYYFIFTNKQSSKVKDIS